MLTNIYDAAPISALTGIVSTQAVTMSIDTPHLTAERRLTEPTPIILPEMTWVVETGILNICDTAIASEPAVCAQNPSTGVILVILLPMVFMILHPPDMVPIAIAVKQAKAIHSGMAIPCSARCSVGCSHWGRSALVCR